MSSGDAMDVPIIMHSQEAASMPWTTPIGLAGNKLADLWSDDGGSLAERV